MHHRMHQQAELEIGQFENMFCKWNKHSVRSAKKSPKEKTVIKVNKAGLFDFSVYSLIYFPKIINIIIIL